MSNEYFDNTGSPPTGGPLSSALIRAEFQKIEAGFDKLPVLSTGSNKLLAVNSSGTAIEATETPAINGGTIDGAVIGEITPEAAFFTTATASDPIAVDTNTTQLATTAFVLAQAASATSPMNGSAAVGSSKRFARQDHVHPSDTSRAPTANPTFTGVVTLGRDPASAMQAATKQYVDANATGIDNHASVKCATTANITLSGPQTIDGYSAVATDRVLVKNQASSIANGVYVVAAGAWTRATDWDGAGEVKQGSYVFVENGTAYAKTGWTQQTTGTITVGTTAQVFQQFSAANNYSAGAGLNLTGSVFSLDAPVTVANGGSGAVSLTGILKGTGVTAFAPATGTDVTALIGANAVTNATNATHRTGGVAGAVHWQSGVGVSAYTAAGTAGQILTSNGTSAPTWTAQSALAAGTATTATHVAGGVAGAVHYQSGAGATGFSAAGTAGQVLISGGTGAPTWVAQSSIAAGSAATATTAASLATPRTIDGQSFNGTANITVIAPATVAATVKATPVDADLMPLVDSAASNVLKKVTWANIKATLLSTLGVQIAGATAKATLVDADDFVIADSAASNATKSTTWANLKATLVATLSTWTAAQRGTVTVDNDGSFNMATTNNFKCTPTAGFTLTFTSIAAGQSGFILLVNGSNYAVAAAATTKVSADTLATISATGTYLLSYFSDGTNVYVAASGAMA